MYSLNITGAPVTLFLGAGATKPLGKRLMGEFINDLYGDQRFASDPLFKRIVYDKWDLEYLLEELEDWTEKGYIQRELPGPSLLEGILGSPKQTHGLSGLLDPVKFTGIPRYAQDLLDALRRKVFDAYKQIEEPAAAVRLLAPLLDGIFTQVDARQHPLVIFTTNYDPAIETCCNECERYALDDGFAQEGGAFLWQRKNFDNFALSSPKQHIVLFKLHGSASWARRGEQIVRLPFGVYAEPGGDFENALIYPAMKKVALHDPFFTAYDYFQRTMDACGCCIVIGYSFRDYDALTKLASASIFNPRLRLLIVDPDSETLCRELSRKGIRCTPAPQRFGEDMGYMQMVSEHVAETLRNQQPRNNTVKILSSSAPDNAS